ncbi:sulfite exporter TauE/SafE family protein [Auritidibacter ignavus]|uniref:Probable membrane transporter protein n=1 Tax=Auritidibacter ignavus TaxID=678932 RepID=A0AAJ6DCV2_9MICC|nr:sulfite exporter TauE/SafE family protein [Auritidibacter ignavus]WGH93222.1 sulfite exporter TauE/SafE family protein [Auritidibacter ignavus]
MLTYDEIVGTLIIIVLAVMVGTVLQRLSGTGVGLVVAPVLSLVLGPTAGVLLTNMTTTISGFLLMLSVWSRIRWRQYWWIIIPALPGAWAGAWLVSQLSAAWLFILLGTIIVLALLITVSLRDLPEFTGRTATVVTGTLGGLFNSTSGVAAPVMVIYARISRWDQRSFAATLQPIFMTMGALSVVMKLWTGAVEDSPEAGVSLAVLVVFLVVAIVGGLAIALLLSRYVSALLARRMAMTLAGLGGISAIVRGVFQLSF